MKRTLLTTALLAGISGLAIASTDGFVVETTEHPHEDAKSVEHSVWIEKVADDEHTYEIRFEDGEYIVKLDGKEVSDDQLKKEGNAIIILADDGGTLHEFHMDGAHNSFFGKNTNKPMIFMTHDQKGNMNQWVGEGGEHMVFVSDEKSHPKVMLGVYTGEPGDSLREHLGIKGDAIVVEKVIKGLSADKAGIKDKDIIISINGSDGLSSEGLTKLLSKHNPGDEIKVVVLRKGQKMKLNTKLLAYDAEALGHTNLPGGGTWITNDGTGNVQFPGGARFFSDETQNLTHEKILDALRENGISEKQIREIEEQIRSSLHENVWSQFGSDRQGGIIDLRVESGDMKEQKLLVEQMQRKAEEAMRDAQRLTMEYKDGQLLLKRHAEGLQDHIHQLEDKLHAAMPEIENELNDRMAELEDRLNELESVLDERMENLTGLIERLIERLDED